MMNAIELFAGAGGLGMGVSLAGFKTSNVIEFDKWACDTIRENKDRDQPLVRSWRVVEDDVRHFPFLDHRGRVDLIAGGPPCQPFSMGGKHRAQLDDRDMFPAMIGAIRATMPKAFIVENVKGLTRETFHNYFEYIKLQLRFPHVLQKRNESWTRHMARLEECSAEGYGDNTTYELIPRLVNAADYGIPQKRQRIFLVGLRHDLHATWSFPEETHSLEALLHSQYVSGEYWDKHKVARKHRPETSAPTKAMREKMEKAISEGDKPWMTVRDALQGMPAPERGPGAFLNHTYQPGARVYPGHTGSPIDLPAKTLKAGVHGVPGGENMMVKPDGSVRYFTIREAARLQTFPDTYILHGAWSEAMRQLGNAVPVALARVVASSVAAALISAEENALKARLQRKGRLQ